MPEKSHERDQRIDEQDRMKCGRDMQPTRKTWAELDQQERFSPVINKRRPKSGRRQLFDKIDNNN